jgi:S-adenosylmethionine uptake transporter
MDAFFWSVAIVLVRIMSRRESARVIVTYMFLLILPLSAIPAAFVWRTPDAHALGLLLALSVCSTLGHYCATRAFVAAEASAVMPVDYLRMVWYASIGYLVFDEIPDAPTLAGAALIAGASLYILRREAALART